jgi:hypothetical protein
LSDFYRILKPSGLALLCLGQGEIIADMARDYFGAPMYWSHYDADTYLRILQQTGFTIVWSRPVMDALDIKAAQLFVLAQKGDKQRWMKLTRSVARGVRLTRF